MPTAGDAFAGCYNPGNNPTLLLAPGLTPATVAASANTLVPKPRFLHVSGAAGSVTYTANGVSITETLEVGYHPIRPDVISAIAGGTTIVAWS